MAKSKRDSINAGFSELCRRNTFFSKSKGILPLPFDKEHRLISWECLEEPHSSLHILLVLSITRQCSQKVWACFPHRMQLLNNAIISIKKASKWMQVFDVQRWGINPSSHKFCSTDNSFFRGILTCTICLNIQPFPQKRDSAPLTFQEPHVSVQGHNYCDSLNPKTITVIKQAVT